MRNARTLEELSNSLENQYRICIVTVESLDTVLLWEHSKMEYVVVGFQFIKVESQRKNDTHYIWSI